MKTILMPRFGNKISAYQLVTVIIQDYNTLRILEVVYTNQEGFLETLKTGKMVYFLLPRNRLLTKEEMGGNMPEVRKILISSCGDAVIYQIIPSSNSCYHTDRYFYSVLGSCLEIKMSLLKDELAEVSPNIS